MLSNEELPDIIWYSFAADAESLLEDGIIRDLTDLLPKYAPNYWKFLQENPLYYKSMMTDSGKFFGFGFSGKIYGRRPMPALWYARTGWMNAAFQFLKPLRIGKLP